MITLNTPPQVNSVLGGNTPIGYDRLVLSPLTFDPQRLLITARVNLTSVANPDMQPIVGTLEINTSQGKLQMEVPQIDFYRRITLSGAQITSINSLISNAQNSVEAGIVSVGVVAGTQSGGS